jgi:hypothetical protein
MTPDSNQYLPIHSPEELFFNCTLSREWDDRWLIWEVNGRQINYQRCCIRSSFEQIGVFVERADVTQVFGGTEIHLIITGRARRHFMDVGISVYCLSGRNNSLDIWTPTIHVRSYGMYVFVKA